MNTNNLYPIFIKLDQIQTLIVGGGNVGLEKVRFILKQSPEALIKVVSKEFHPQIIRLALENSNLKLAERRFENFDLEGVKLLVLATNDSFLNTQILEQAKAKNILTNVVDNPSLCEFYTSAVLNKGAVKIAVSSNGVSPTLAKRLRDVLDDVIPNEVEDTAQFLKQIRARLTGDFSEKIKTLNAITEGLCNDLNHTQQVINNSVTQH